MAEQIELVDESGKPVGQAEVKAAHTRQLLHHSVHIVLIDSKGRFFCAYRSPEKAIYGGYWTVPGAHVLPGETYGAAAKRLLKSVFGLDCELEAVGKIRVRDGIENEVSMMYVGHSDEQFKVKPDQFDDGRFLAPEDARRFASSQKVTPYLLHSIELCAKRH